MKALGIGPGDEVILPAFTCVVVASAVKYCGATPVYVDVEEHTYNINASLIAAKITHRTKIILAQNTFGLVPDYDTIQHIADAHNITVIEDCTHGLGSTYRGRKSGTLTRASFFSTQWNKPYSTGLGGFVICNEDNLAEKLRVFEQQLVTPSMTEAYMLQLQIWLRKYIMRPAVYWPLLKMYRYASHKGWVSGSSDNIELTSTNMPPDYLKGCSDVQAKEGIRQLKHIKKILAHRQKIAHIYQNHFQKKENVSIRISKQSTHTFLKYPVLVKNRSAIMQKAESARIPLGDWMNSPLHPVQNGLEKWDYHWGENPVAEYVSQHIINLPTGVSEEMARRVLTLLSDEQINV